MKKNTKIIITTTIIILVLIIIGLSIYIAYDKNIIFQSSVDIEEKQEKTKKQNKSDIEKNTKEEIDYTFNNAKISNNSNGYNYYLSSGNLGDIGIHATLKEDIKSVKLSVDWSKMAINYNNKSHSNTTETYTINFDKEITEVYLGDFGVTADLSTLFFLMKDKTIEYMPIRKATDTNNFVSYGKLPDVDGTIKFLSGGFSIPNSPVGGGLTTFAQKEDGTFLDLEPIIESTGNYSV